MAEEDPDNARPKYKAARNEDQTSASKGVFSDIVEAEGFWRRLWEERGTGDENAEWLKEIELAISQRVPLPTVGTWGLFLESPETFRAHFGCYNTLCIFKTKTSRGTKLCSYIYFHSLYNI